MTFERVTTEGNGVVKYALVIEGWPEIFVTHSSLTLSNGADGRSVIAGLKYDGIRIKDRVLLSEAKVQADGITFSIAPPSGTKFSSGGTDPATTALSQYPIYTAALAATVDEDDTSMSILGGGSLADGVYHIGTEAFRVSTSPTVSRAIWDTQPQGHSVTDPRDATRAVFIYSRPPAMEGRRAYLYAYDDDDDPDDLTGSPAWRGIVHKAPRLASDCLTWQIQVEPITYQLKQTVAASLPETNPVGIYHSWTGSFGVQIVYEGAGGEAKYVFRHNGIDSLDTLRDTINSNLASFISGAGATDIDSLTFEYMSDGSIAFKMHTDAAAVPTLLDIKAASPVFGHVNTFLYSSLWQDVISGEPVGPNNFAVDRDFVVTFVYGFRGITDVAAPLGNGSMRYTSAGVPLVGIGGDAFTDHFRSLIDFYVDLMTNQDVEATWPEWRVYVADDLTGAESVYMEDVAFTEGLEFNHILTVSGTGSTAHASLGDLNYIEVEPMPQGFLGIANAANAVKVLRSYAASGNVTDFVSGLKTASVDANDGDTPFVTGADLDTWAKFWTGIIPSLDYRTYEFVRSVAIEDILAEELKLAAGFMYIASDGRIGCRGLVLPTSTITVSQASHMIEAIITPHSGAGSWPRVDPQRDGVVVSATVQDFYDPVEDEWIDVPEVYTNVSAIAEHKNRGKRVEIKPFSRAPQGPSFFFRRTLAETIGKYLDFFGRDYIVVTVEVPFKHFAVLCGDVVTLTDPRVPDGEGSRGVSDRRGICVEREWNLDPGAGPVHGRLSIWIPARDVHGYAPSAKITGQTNTSGNTWNITCSTADALNIALSTDDDGLCLEHFSDGDYVRVIEHNTSTLNQVTGVISGTPNAQSGTCTVVFDATWTPSTDTWILEFQADSGSTAQAGQREYVYAADNSLDLSGGGKARLFS